MRRNVGEKVERIPQGAIQRNTLHTLATRLGPRALQRGRRGTPCAPRRAGCDTTPYIHYTAGRPHARRPFARSGSLGRPSARASSLARWCR